MEIIDIKKLLMEADEDTELNDVDMADDSESEFDDTFGGDDPASGGDFSGDFGSEGDDFGDEGIDSDVELGDMEGSPTEDASEDVLDKISSFLNSKHSSIDKDGNIVNSGEDVTDLENSDKIEDKIKAYLTKLSEPAENILKYVDYDKNYDKYIVDVDKYFRIKVKEYPKLNSEEKLDRIKDDLYYLVNKFKKIYSKKINMVNIPNEIYQSIEDKFGDDFSDDYTDIERDRYKFDDTNPDVENEDKNKDNDKEDEAFLWENIMNKEIETILIPLNEDNYYAKAKGDLLELGFREKEGWFVYIGSYIKIASNIDFDVVVTTNFEGLTGDYDVTEKSFTNNISDGIIFASGLIGVATELSEELEILKKTFDIADKVKAKLFG